MMRAEGISKSFGEKTVLSGFTADFSDSGITWIMGGSGCGKTTLLRILAGLEKYEGTLTGFDRRISVVFQEDRLFEELTPLENCLLAGKKKAEEISALLISTGLTDDDIRRKTSLLSGGMKRRTAIVRALCMDAGILLMDEPFSSIDKENRLLTAETVSRIYSGKPVIAVTHDITDTDLIKGKIIQMQ